MFTLLSDSEWWIARIFRYAKISSPIDQGGVCRRVLLHSLVEQTRVVCCWPCLAQRKSGNLISGSYEPQFKLSHELKDLYYALELGRDLGDPLPITAVVSQIYNAGMRKHAGDDMSAVAEAYLNRVNARPAQG